MHMTLWILLCCLFPFLMTVLGSAAVFLCPRGIHETARRVFLGFAAGVMLAASVWSLLNPAITAAQTLGLPGWLPASVGLTAGVLFLLGADAAVTRFRSADSNSVYKCRQPNGRCIFRRKHSAESVIRESDSTFLLQLAMITHNIPEGMAVGLSVALAADAAASVGITDGVFSIGAMLGNSDGTVRAQMMAALALSLGIGIQNLPEGAAVSLPLRQDGIPTGRAFLRGCLSGVVEPIFGLLTALVLSEAHAVMPWLLSFAAGSMLYVVVGELIPSANSPDAQDTASGHGDSSCIGTLSTAAGFLVMMVLDVALG